MIKRRDFIQKSAYTAIGLGMVPSFNFKTCSALETLNVGVIGCKGMGWSNIMSLHRSGRARCIAVCDIDQNVLDGRLAELKGLGIAATGYKDYRKLLENRDVDAVIIGTPDHWHCLNTVDALAAGKHVYVEKPIANTIEECRLMVKAAEKHGKIVQVGQWQRSGPHYAEAIEIVKSGKIGNIRLVKCWAYQGWMKPVPKVADSAPPKGVDYKMWLGPAPDRPFNKNRFHFTFRWFWDYAGGLMTDWGVHEIDIALLAMGASSPNSVMASGGKLAYPDDASETPDTLQAIFEYDDFTMLWEHATGIDNGNYGRREGIAFIGNNGTLVVNRQGYDVLEEYRGSGEKRKALMDPIEAVSKSKGKYLDLHTANFLDAIRDNDSNKLKTNIQSGSIAAINAQMGNIAFKTGEKLYFDKASGKFKNNAKANKLIMANYHQGWKLPEV